MNKQPKTISWLNFFCQIKDHLPQLFKFILAGGSAAILDFGVFTLFLKFVEHSPGETDKFYTIAIANCSGILAGFLWGFFLQKYWAFRARNKGWQQFVATAILLLFNMTITSLAIPMLATGFNLSSPTAKIIMQAVVVIWNYLIYHFFIFKQTGEQR